MMKFNGMLRFEAASCGGEVRAGACLRIRNKSNETDSGFMFPFIKYI
jgi:hypothetical protein